MQWGIIFMYGNLLYMKGTFFSCYQQYMQFWHFYVLSEIDSNLQF